MATQNEEALRVLRADVEARRSNADTERQKLEALLAEKTAMASSLEQAAHTREEKLLVCLSADVWWETWVSVGLDSRLLTVPVPGVCVCVCVSCTNMLGLIV